MWKLSTIYIWTTTGIQINALPDQFIQGTNRNKDFSEQDPLLSHFTYVEPVAFSQNRSLCSILLERQATTGFQNLTARDWSAFSKSCIFIRQNKRTFYWSIIITFTRYWLYFVVVIEYNIFTGFQYDPWFCVASWSLLTLRPLFLLCEIFKASMNGVNIAL